MCLLRFCEKFAQFFWAAQKQVVYVNVAADLIHQAVASFGNQEHFVVNISLGVYSRKPGGLLDCQGDCKVCQAVIEAAKQASQNIFFTIAAGNRAGIPTCPAKVGLIEHYSSPPVLAVTSEAILEHKAARGNIVAPGKYVFTYID